MKNIINHSVDGRETGGAGYSDLLKQSAYFSSNELLYQLSEAVSVGILVLNQDHEIVYANREFLTQVGLTDKDIILGHRFGEAVNCIFAVEKEGGCGKSEFCKTCNVCFSIMQAEQGKRSTHDGQITRIIGETKVEIDLQFGSTLIEHEGEIFTVVNVRNVADEKRRRTLEEIFFHELVNNAGAIQSLLSLYSSKAEEETFGLDYGELLSQVSNQILTDIDAQRQLLSAERGDLTVIPMDVQSLSFMVEIMDSIENYFLGGERRLRLAPDAIEVSFNSDRAILARVLRYMMKIALEWTPEGETAVLGCDEQDNRVRFWAHFPAYLLPEEQALVFQRRVSSKGVGRGVETYSMKLLSERYLQGEIRFETDPDAGSKFVVWYPKELEIG